MITQTYKVKGLTPYFFNKWTNDKTPKTVAQSIQVAKNRVYKNDQGLFIPGLQFKGSLIHAVSLQKMKIEKSNKRAVELIRAVLQIEPKEIALGLDESAIQIIPIPTIVAENKMKEIQYAYIESGWKVEFKAVFHEILEPEFIAEGFEWAGLLCGVGGRRNHGNGRFEITESNIIVN